MLEPGLPQGMRCRKVRVATLRPVPLRGQCIDSAYLPLWQDLEDRARGHSMPRKRAHIFCMRVFQAEGPGTGKGAVSPGRHKPPGKDLLLVCSALIPSSGSGVSSVGEWVGGVRLVGLRAKQEREAEADRAEFNASRLELAGPVIGRAICASAATGCARSAGITGFRSCSSCHKWLAQRSAFGAAPIIPTAIAGGRVQQHLSDQIGKKQRGCLSFLGRGRCWGEVFSGE